MLWRRDDDWFYEFHPIDVDSGVFPAFASLIELWRSKRRGNALPRWRDFDLQELQEWWGWLAVYDLDGPDAEIIRVRLWGSNIAEISEFDLTGKIMTAMPDAEMDARHITPTDIEFHRKAAQSPCIGHAYGPVTIRFDAGRDYHVLGLPLVRAGPGIDQLLYGVRLLSRTVGY